MSSSVCLIRFGASDDASVAYVSRDRHGHPENVLANIHGLQTVISHQPAVPKPGNIAVQFLLIDTLHYLYQSTSLRELGAAVHRLVYDPDRVDERMAAVLRYHSAIDGESPVGDIEFVYDVEVAGLDAADWHLAIARFAGEQMTAAETLDAAQWRRRGTLVELDELFG